MSLAGSATLAHSSGRCWRPRHSSGRCGLCELAILAASTEFGRLPSLLAHSAIVLQAAEANAASLSKAQQEHSHLQKVVLGDLKCATSLCAVQC